MLTKTETNTIRENRKRGNKAIGATFEERRANCRYLVDRYLDQDCIDLGYTVVDIFETSWRNCCVLVMNKYTKLHFVFEDVAKTFLCDGKNIFDEYEASRLFYQCDPGAYPYDPNYERTELVQAALYIKQHVDPDYYPLDITDDNIFFEFVDAVYKTGDFGSYADIVTEQMCFVASQDHATLTTAFEMGIPLEDILAV